ncbi:MAG: response regulator [Deltaproteobacteria bacterium]|nr:response regulator [Deltaproteobacteria bacterium]
MDADVAPHLVIVDDEPVILQILKAVFEDEPYRLTLAATGSEARDVFQEKGVDILLTDKNLPDMNGLDLLKVAKEVNPDAEVIILTGYASLETALAAIELDAFDYVLKPLNNVFDIRKKVRRALEKQRIVRENRDLLIDLQDKNQALESSLEETRRLQAELIQSEKLAGIGTLAAGIAHEVSSPLFGILGLAEAILEEDRPDLVRSYAGDIVEYCQTIRSIVQDLSGYSRAARSEYLTTVDLPHVIEDAVRLVERSTDVRGIDIALDLAPETFVQARTNEIQQVFVNLVKNAIEALAPQRDTGLPAHVRIRCGGDSGHVWAEVEDDGPGIPEASRSLVFDPFYTTKQPGKGTGLGLNIVYRIVTKYRGTIQVDAAEAGGTVFRMRFPSDA